MAFLATAQVNVANGWENAKDLNDGVKMKTRDIIKYINEHFEENISPGSYDDIRRSDLNLPLIGEVVLRTNERLAKMIRTVVTLSTLYLQIVYEV